MWLYDLVKRHSKSAIPTVGFLGIGKSNLSLIERLSGLPVKFVFRAKSALSKEICSSLPVGEYFTDGKMLEGIGEDVLFLSPTARRDSAKFTEAEESGTYISSDCDAHFETERAESTIIITGSDGKSTTTALASEILSDSGGIACGNFGVPFSSINEGPRHLYCAELSSFNLNFSRPKSLRAAVTNLTPNHLDWHTDFNEYIQAKKNALYNTEGAVINFDCPISSEFATDVKLLAGFSENEDTALYRKCESFVLIKDDRLYLDGRELISLNEMKLRGRHTLKNAACALCLTLGLADTDKAISEIKSFGGLKNRCEICGTIRGITFINSSIDTSPSRCAATLCSLDRPVHLIMGGKGKGLSPFPLLAPLSKYAKSIMLYGEYGDELYAALKDVGCEIIMHEKFDEAFYASYERAAVGDTVLLSPGATAYGEFSSFEERGKRFIELARGL